VRLAGHRRKLRGRQLPGARRVPGREALLSERRDHVSFEGECPRGAGFWCQNQGGKNPNLSAEEFQKFAQEAATLLEEVPTLDTSAEVAAAVCNTGDQLLRQLATLALNLAADTLDEGTKVTGEPYPTVGAAFQAGMDEDDDDGDDTLEIDASAWPAHKAHGDTIGACS
jgi:hypothetical protein